MINRWPYAHVRLFQIMMQIMHFSPFYTKRFGVIVTIKYKSSWDKSTPIVSIENSKLKAVIFSHIGSLPAASASTSVVGWSISQNCKVRSSCLSLFMEKNNKFRVWFAKTVGAQGNLSKLFHVDVLSQSIACYQFVIF